ncbi:MAG TPA: cytochrome P450, partial [Acidimicrobiia bacterium]|nr:cytochrome P450 [Acidimicrobiia bacterium]
PAFTPARAEEARPVVREIIGEILDRVAPRGHCDVATEISGELPIRVLCRLIGVSEADVSRFAAWTHMIGAGMDMNLLEVIDGLNEAIAGLCDYVEEIIRDRRSNPVRPPDLVQTMIDATEGGDRLTIEEVRDQVVLLLGAGYDTTSTQISWSVLTYLDHPTEWKRLAEEPERAAAAVEELLRFSPAIGLTARFTTDDVEYNGILIPAGSFLLMGVPSAGRDPAAFAAADEFRIDRSDGMSHLTFGVGAHYCVGAHLARVELQEVLPALARRLVDPRRAGQVEIGNPLGVWDVKSLPIEYTPEVTAPS